MDLREASVLLFVGILSGLVLISGLAKADSPQPDILLVRDAHADYSNSDVAPYFIDALEANNLDYKNCTVEDGDEDGPGYSSTGCDEERKMEDYDIVIWFTGEDYGADTGTGITLTDADNQSLSKYLRNGGKLFLTGQAIGRDKGNVYPEFFEHYLFADFEEKCTEGYCDDVSGKSNDPVSDDPTGIISSVVQNLNYDDADPDDIDQESFLQDLQWISGKEVLTYKDTLGKDEDAGVRGDTGGPDGYKSVYFSFAFELINDTADRNRLMENIFNYLSGPKTKNAKVYPKSLDNTSYVDLNVTCDPADTYCLREMDPKINATCRNYQLFADVDGAEYIFNGHGKNMTPVDGSFDEDTEPVEKGVDGSWGPTNYFNTFTASVRCNDTDGYWGKYDNYTFKIDRRQPSTGSLSIQAQYTSAVDPSIQISLDSDYDYDIPDYMRFSCNRTNWTSWRSYSSSYSNFNISNPQAGCNTTDGNRTVYLQTRDRAGNLRNYTGYDKDWVVLDRQAPKIDSILPGNKSYLSSQDNLTINFHDPKASDGTHAGVDANRSWNRTNWIPIWNASDFDPGWTAEGQQLLAVWINDSVGNLNQTNYTFYVDDSPPLVKIQKPENTTYDKNESLPLNFTASDELAGVDKCWYSIDGGANQSLPNCQNTTFNTSEGHHELVLYSNDSLATTGNVNSTSISFTADVTPPAVSLVSPNNQSWLSDQTPDFTFNVTDNLAGELSCTLYMDGNPNGTKTVANASEATITSSSLSEGSHQWWVNCTDGAGNEGQSPTRVIRIDVTEPSVTLNSPSSGSWLPDQTPQFNFTSTDNLAQVMNSTLLVDLQPNNWTWAQNDTPTLITSSSLSQGKHNWTIRSEDNATNSKESVTWDFTVDIDPPSIQLNAPPNNSWTTDTTPQFNFTPTDNLDSTLDCTAYVEGSDVGSESVANNTPETIDSTKELDDGERGWWVNCSDEAGNEGQSASRFINIDTTPPSTSDNATSTWTDLNQTVLLTCEDNHAGCNQTLYCVYPEGSSCEANQPAENITPRGKLEVNYTLEVGCSEEDTCEKYVNYTSNDSLGNLESPKTSDLVRIDKEKPNVTIQSPANGSTYSGVVDLLTEVDDPNVDKSWYEVRNGSDPNLEVIDSGDLTAPDWDSSWDSSAISNGTFIFNVSANDTFGHLRKNVNVTFEVDNRKPALSVNYPDKIYLNESFNLDLSAESVRAPTENISYTYYNISNETWFKFNDSGININQPSYNFTDFFNISNKSDGNYSTFFWANDTAGEVANKTSWFVIDRVAPSITLNSPPNESWLASKTVNFNFTAKDSLDSKFYCSVQIDGNVNTTLEVENATPTLYSQEISEGQHGWKVNCTDGAGNKNISSTSTVHVDVSKPSVSLNNPSSGSWVSDQTPQFNFTPSDNLASVMNCTLSVDSTERNWSWAQNGTPNQIVPSSSLNQGKHNWTISCEDNATNSKESVSWDVWVDVDKPQIQLNSPQNETWTTDTTPTFNFTPTDNLDSTMSCTAYVEGDSVGSSDADNNTPTTITSAQELNDGQREWWVNCTDEASNENRSASRFLQIDTTPPETTDNSSSEWSSSNQTILLSCEDRPTSNPVGCNETLYCVYSEGGTCTPGQVPANITPKGETEVNYTLEVGCPSNQVCENYTRYFSNDTLGNMEDNKTSSKIRIDKATPVTTIQPNGSNWRNSNISFEFSCQDQGSGCNITEWGLANPSESCTVSNLTETGNGTVGCVEGQVLKKKVCFRSNDTVNNTETLRESELFKIDKKSPKTWNYQLNISQDTTFGDRRIYPGDAVKFEVNISDARGVSYVEANLSKPSGYQKKALSLDAGNETNGTWSFTYAPSSLGTYIIQNLTANDTLGNERVVNSGAIAKNFTVVNGSLSVLLGSNSSLNAGYNETFNLTFDFNKTFSNPNLTLWVPPNSPGSLNLTPHYLNVSGYSCPEGCDVATYRGNQSHPIRLNLSLSGNLTNFTLTTAVEAETLVNDTNGRWTLEWYGFDYKNRTKVKAPFLNVSKVICAGKQTCKVNQSQAFELNVTVENVQDSGHSGIARNVELKANSSLGQNTSSLNNISSGANQTASFNWNISQVGNYTFSFKAWDFTKQYNDSRSKTIQVLDTEKPSLLNISWEEDNLFNKNETVSYKVKASDNVKISTIWLELESGSYQENVSLDLYKRYDEYDWWNLTYQNDTTGRYNITQVYINDTQDNFLNSTPTGEDSWFRIKELKLNVTAEKASVVISNNQVLSANITGNASAVEKVEALVGKPRNFNETVQLTFQDNISGKLKFNGTYSNVTRSGNYSVNISVDLASGISLAETTNFSAPYGNSSIQAENLTLIKNTKKNVTWFIFPQNGDLIDLNGTLQPGNESLLNLSSWENQTKSFGNVTWEKYNSSGLTVSWEINVSNSTGETNLTLSLNSSLHSLGSERNKTIWVNVIENETTKPDINNVSHSYSQMNLYQTNSITVNATDVNTSIDKVTVEMNYSQSGKTNLSTTLIASGLYELNFENTNETGNFSYRAYAWDVAGNVENSSWYEFNISDEYENVTVTHSPYNKGDNITFQVNVTDVRGEPVENFNLTLTLKRNETGNYSVVNNSITDKGSYQIQVDDSPQSNKEKAVSKKYTIYSTVVKNGNQGGYQEKFTVSEENPTTINYPDDDQTFDPSGTIPVNVTVTNQDGNTIDDAAVTAYCPKCPNKDYERIEWNSSIQKYYDPSAFTAPSDRTSFSILAYSTDFWKNKGKDAKVPTTEEEAAPATEEGGNGGGGGGGGGAAPPPPEVEVLRPPKSLPSTADETWLEVRTDGVGECEFAQEDFGYGNGTDFDESNGTYHRAKVGVSTGKSYYYKIKCKVEGRVSEDSTAFSVKPKMVKKFKTEYERMVLVPRGENVTVWVDFINVGDKGLTVVPAARSECCDLRFAIQEVWIRPGSRKSVGLQVHVPLSVQPRNYTSFLTFKSGKVERERIIEIGVSEHLLTRQLSEINRSIPELRKDLKDLEKAGLDVSSLKEKLGEVQSGVKEGGEAVQSDDLEELRANVKEAQRKRNQIEGKIGGLKFKQFLLENKWNILAAILVFFFGSYLLTQLLIPWYSLRKTIKSLEEGEEGAIETRKKAERQYFKREIDEPTFREIMTKEQDRILHLRGEVEKNERRLHTLVSRALSPRKILVFPVNSARKLYGKLVELKGRKEGFKEYLIGGMSTLREGLEEIGGMEIEAGAKMKSWVFRVPEALAGVFQKIKPTKKIGKAVREYGKKRKEFKRPEEEKEREFEERVKPELKGIQKPEERVSKLTELRRKIEKERSERDKKEEK